MTQKVKIFTFTNNTDKNLTLNGITQDAISIAAGESADVRVSKLLAGWSDRMKSWGRFVQVESKFDSLEDPELVAVTPLANLNFIAGTDTIFNIRVISNDYIKTMANIKASFNGTDVYTIYAYVNGFWQEITNSGVLLNLNYKTRTIKFKAIIGTGYETEAITGNMVVTISGADFEAVELSEEITVKYKTQDYDNSGVTSDTEPGPEDDPDGGDTGDTGGNTEPDDENP